ncbi:Saccharopine dehydrogenase [Batrachochytrium dendrobatidis]|nr:Saccharopine dehydrogenase [Batrachochytrium dendrobatidis]
MSQVGVSQVHLWLRAETKNNEQRTALTPSVCKTLLAKGFCITVECCNQRIFKDVEYEKIGCTLAPHGSWRFAPAKCFIIGLKEFSEKDDFPLCHKHIMFAHCFKGQDGWKDVLGRFVRGGGLLLDLEFLAQNGRRIAAFGYHAGYAGAAVGLDVWCHRQLSPSSSLIPKQHPFSNDSDLIKHIRTRLEKAGKAAGKTPSIMVIGALGRCGRGACDLARAVGLPESSIVKWDMAETAAGGPFNEILRHDVFVNCIYLSQPIAPFLTTKMLQDPSRVVSVITDVSCDATNPHNPIPVYYGASTFDNPVIKVEAGRGSVDVIAIDHLPTLLPREASEAFCNDLLPSLLELVEPIRSPVWTDAATLFFKKSQALRTDAKL